VFSTTWFTGMVSRVCCLVAYLTWWALLLFVLAVGSVSDVVGRVALVCCVFGNIP